MPPGLGIAVTAPAQRAKLWSACDLAQLFPSLRRAGRPKRCRVTAGQRDRSWPPGGSVLARPDDSRWGQLAASPLPR